MSVIVTADNEQDRLKNCKREKKGTDKHLPFLEHGKMQDPRALGREMKNQNICVMYRIMGEPDCLPWIRGILEELAFGRENNQGNIGVAQDGDLMGLFEEPCPPLRECHLPANLVLDPLQLNSSPPHNCGMYFSKPSSNLLVSLWAPSCWSIQEENPRNPRHRYWVHPLIFILRRRRRRRSRRELEEYWVVKRASFLFMCWFQSSNGQAEHILRGNGKWQMDYLWRIIREKRERQEKNWENNGKGKQVNRGQGSQDGLREKWICCRVVIGRRDWVVVMSHFGPLTWRQSVRCDHFTSETQRARPGHPPLDGFLLLFPSSPFIYCSFCTPGHQHHSAK